MNLAAVSNSGTGIADVRPERVSWGRPAWTSQHGRVAHKEAPHSRLASIMEDCHG